MRAGLAEVHGGIPKEQRYNWLSRNKPGQLCYIAKHVLKIDHGYQRALNDDKRKRIAANFNWAAFGVLLVGRRGGDLFVVDGQHRLAAALSRSDVSDVPVAIFDLGGSRDEAVDFLVANKDRRPLSGIEAFKAQITTNDPHAILVQELVAASGREVGVSSPKTVACVANLYRFAQADAEALKSVWPVVVELCRDEKMDNRLVGGLFTLERRLTDSSGEQRSLSEVKIKRLLLEAGYSRLMNSIIESAAYYKRGGEAVFARGCLNVLNYRRQNRFRYNGAEEA